MAPASRTIALTAALAVLIAQGCDQPSRATAPTNSTPGFDVVDLPAFDPSSFVDRVTNPYFPLFPGHHYSYEAETKDGVETTEVEVLNETKTILGITATVVRDRVFLDGELIEDTFDWYAQDAVGNVWYLGEDTKEYEDGEVVSTEGSWEAGVDGATAGIIMWSDPAAHVGDSYRQEFLEGEAEDFGMVVATDATVEVPFGRFVNCLETEDWSALEDVPPDEREHKFYCPGVGTVLEQDRSDDEVRVELQTITASANAPTVDNLQTGSFGPDVYAEAAPDGAVWLRVRLRDAGDEGPWDWRIHWGEGDVVTVNDLARSGEFVFLHVGPYATEGAHTVVVTATDPSGATSAPAAVTSQ